MIVLAQLAGLALLAAVMVGVGYMGYMARGLNRSQARTYRREIALGALGLTAPVLTLAMSYQFALWGHPGAVWFWRALGLL